MLKAGFKNALILLSDYSGCLASQNQNRIYAAIVSDYLNGCTGSTKFQTYCNLSMKMVTVDRVHWLKVKR